MGAIWWMSVYKKANMKNITNLSKKKATSCWQIQKKLYHASEEYILFLWKHGLTNKRKKKKKKKRKRKKEEQNRRKLINKVNKLKRIKNKRKKNNRK